MSTLPTRPQLLIAYRDACAQLGECHLELDVATLTVGELQKRRGRLVNEINNIRQQYDALPADAPVEAVEYNSSLDDAVAASEQEKVVDSGNENPTA